jgi:hypothetical protein
MGSSCLTVIRRYTAHMADEQDQAQDQERTNVRAWYQGEQARLREVSPAEWREERDAEVRLVREWAADRRRHVA